MPSICKLILVPISVLVFLTACSGSSKDTEPLLQMDNAFLPYIESIDCPSEVLSTEEFPVTLHISSILDSEIQNGLPAEIPINGIDTTTGPALIHSAVLRNQSHQSVHLEPWIIKPARKGATTSAIFITLRFDHPGEYQLSVASAKDAASGGLQRPYEYPSGLPLYAEKRVLSFPITVLPAEDAPAGDG